MSINKRIKEIIDHTANGSVHGFAKSLGYSRSDKVRNYLNEGVQISSDTITKISEIYPEINIKWLFSGKGNMLLDSLSDQSSHINSIQVEKQGGSELKKIPYYDIDVLAGTEDRSLDQSPGHPVAYVSMPDFDDSDIVIPVFGNSMLGCYDPGDSIGIKRLFDFDVIEPGLAYVVITKERKMLKYIRNGSSPDVILLASHNKKFEPFEIKKSKIVQLWIVVAQAKRLILMSP